MSLIFEFMDAVVRGAYSGIKLLLSYSKRFAKNLSMGATIWFIEDRMMAQSIDQWSRILVLAVTVYTMRDDLVPESDCGRPNYISRRSHAEDL